MNVAELIVFLESVDDKTLPVWICGDAHGSERGEIMSTLIVNAESEYNEPKRVEFTNYVI